jgi:hypothetical protein
MGHSIAIVGRPGTGKTMGIRTLNPDNTVIFNCDGYPLTFQGGKRNYTQEKKNYSFESDLKQLELKIKSINKERLNITAIIIDTVNGALNKKELNSTMRLSDWADLSKDTHALINSIQPTLRDDLFIFYLFHELEGESGIRSIKTNGRKLSQISVEGLFPTVLFTKVDFVEGKPEYNLITQQDGLCNVKSPENCFDTPTIPNDFQLIIDKITAWE